MTAKRTQPNLHPPALKYKDRYVFPLQLRGENSCAMVKSIKAVNHLNLSPRVIGFDDTPFQSRPRQPGSELEAVGIVSSDALFEGMLYVRGIIQDGMNAGERLADAVMASKFYDQIHAVLVDGITMGGLNVIDIAWLANKLQRPVIAVMRAYPKLERMIAAIEKIPLASERTARLRAAGPIHEIRNWVFQYRCPQASDGDIANDAKVYEEVTPDEVARLLDRCTPQGGQKIAECLRIAHLIGSAIKTGQSSSRA